MKEALISIAFMSVSSAVVDSAWAGVKRRAVVRRGGSDTIITVVYSV
jgi:hypothetical protein